MLRPRPSAPTAALIVLLAPAPLGAEPTFHDVTTAAGVSYVQHVPQVPPGCIYDGVFCTPTQPPVCYNTGSFCEPERMSGGVAVGDVDGDGAQDLFATRVDAPDVLFRNLGDGTFADATVAAGLDLFDLQSNGAAFGDVDNDGDLDLLVTVLGESGDPVNDRHYLFVNRGDGTFTEEAVARAADGSSDRLRRSYSVHFGDYDRDGWIDAHTTEWLPEEPSHSRLLRNRGAAAPGHFVDVTSAAGVALEEVDGFASTFVDLDGDLWPELAVAADFGTSRLFWNDGDGTFTEGTDAAGVGTDENGMGSTFGDYDGDGDLDWFVTAIFDPDSSCEQGGCNWGYSGNRLYRNDGERVFSDATDAAGVRDGAWGWGAAWWDFDNDADVDLTMTNGVDFPTTTLDEPFVDDRVRLWRNDGDGVMSEVAAELGVDDDGSGKGLAVFDYDGDGDLDLFIVNNASTPRLYRNDGGDANDWLRVKLAGTRSNREGLGARVTVRARRGGPEQVRQMGVSTHFLGQSERVAHFGLGPAAGAVARVGVEWPSGAVEHVGGIPARSTLLFVEGVGACRLGELRPVLGYTAETRLDDDADLVCDVDDNCSAHANPDQRDTDGDGFGNRCDPDFDGDGTVGADDLAYLLSRRGSADRHADLDGDGTVGRADAAILRSFLGGPPGPGSVAP